MRTCKVCKSKFEPQFNSVQPVCSIACAIKKSHEEKLKEGVRRAKLRRKDTRERKAKLKTLADWLNEAQTACNAYIRERDKSLPCISCGNTNDVKYCAGHYKTRGAHPELRFHPYNINRQCDWNCNLNLSGNVVKYRDGLIDKIGIGNVQWLEGPQTLQEYTVDDAKEIKIYYREQLKLLKNDN